MINQHIIFTTGVDIELQAVLIAANDFLQRCYINSRYSSTVDEWPPYQPRHYTTLAFIHHKDKFTDATVISVAKELAVAGKFNVDSSSADSTSQTPNIYSNTIKTISDIFVSVTASDGLTINPCIILIEGAPGIGKTILAKEIAFQWANSKLLNNKKILFLVFLRQCNFKSMLSVESFVQYVVKSSEMAPCLAKYLLKTEGNELTILFDGYDEISDEDRNTSIVADIINRRVFGKSCLVITSRPTASSNLHGIVDCRVEVVGFTEEDRLDYIQTALQGNDDKVKALTLYLQSNPTINALCYIPLNMTIMLCLAKDGMDRLPKTQTDMYKKFIEMTIQRFIKKIDIKVFQVITSINRLPNPYNMMFKELARLAYEALKIDNIVFRLNEIEKICPNLAVTSNNWNGLGLLKAVRHVDTKMGNVTFHFLHFSIQEYMAALYISTLSDNEQIQLLKETFWVHRYYNTWIMYIGITCGSSFALKHFLSGNWFQISTRIFKSSNISRKYLGNKIKCLHLFQCLVESNNENMIASVSQFFQDNQIDLDRQTLLPSDVNTLGFFLMRSINKRWKMLNLSGCNIGSIGINILCDRCLNKESRDIVVIEQVDFSYNQLNFSSLTQLFDLCKSWHTSLLIIKESKIFQDHGNSDVYRVIEDAFCSSNHDNQLSLKLGPFLFGHKITKLPLNAVSIKSLYLLNCTLQVTNPEVSVLELLAKQNLIEIHLINTSLSLTKRLSSDLLNTVTNLFIYNHNLLDEDADKICSLIFLNRTTNGIMLIVSNSKIQGMINTSTISEQLTKLEVLNLVINVNQKCFNHMETSAWKGNLCYDSNDKDLINTTFIELLNKITCNKWNWQLRIALIQKDVLIAHKVKYECISEKIRMNQPLNTIYLSDCNITSKEYQILFDTKTTLTSLCIFNSCIDQSWFRKCYTNLLVCKEMFIHSLFDINTKEISSYLKKSHSAVLVTKNEMLGCNPTTKQIALALQIEPSIDVLKLLYCQYFDCIISMLTTTQKTWTELDFMNCELGEIEYKTLQKYLTQMRVNKKNHSTIKMLKVSSNQLTELLVSLLTSFLIEIVLMWKVQQLIFYDISHTVYECFITKFTATVTNVLEEIFLSVIYNGKKDIYFCNCSWSQITGVLEKNSGATLFVVNGCYFPLQSQNLDITELSHIPKLHIISSTFHEYTIVNILETFIERKLKIPIYYTSMNADNLTLYNFITSKKLLCQNGVNFVAIMKNFMCGFNTTEDQLQFLQSKKLSYLEHTIVTLVNDTKQMHEKELFVFQDKQLTALHYAGNIKFVTKSFSVLKNISTLKFFGITITRKAVDNVATALSHNKGCNITDQVTEYLTSIISHNVQLQYFSITNGDLCTTNVIKISKALQNTSELTITSNSTGVTNVIAAVVSNSSIIQKLDLDDTSLQAICIQLMTKRLRSVSNLHISNTSIVDRSTENIVNANSQLQELDISEDAFQIVAITKVLQSSFILKKLRISNNNITNEAADDIAAALSYSTQLKVFDISGNCVGTPGIIKIAKALKQISTLQQLYINNNYITDEAADDIATALSYSTQLKVFDISGNCVGTPGIIKIAKALKQISTLLQLYINNNYITDEAADDIAAALSSSTQLEVFDISGNCVGTPGIIKIAKALKQISTLQQLYINNNYITDEGADDIAAAIFSNMQLREFNVSKNNLHSTGAIKIAKVLQNISTLTKLYINDNNITDKATDHISVALSYNTQLQELDISNNWFQAAGIMRIANALQNIVTLTKLCIGKYRDYSLCDEVANSITVVLYRNTKLQEIDIGLNMNNIIPITRALCIHTNLRVLRIRGNNNIMISNEDIEAIAAAISSNNRLHILDISGMVPLNTLKALQYITSLTNLCISNNCITDKAADDIAAAVSRNTQLQELDISSNLLEGTGAIKISEALKGTSTLKKLFMNNNIITDKAANDIAVALSCNTQLQELDISDNYFQAVGTMTITKALQGIFTLTKLYISNTNNITDEAADDIAAAICSNTHLQDFDISNNHLQSTGAIKIAKALQNISTLKKLYINDNHITDVAADDVAAALSSNNRLQELDISNTKLQSAGIITIVKAFKNISTLKILCLNNNNVTDEAADDIAAVIYNNTQLQELNISKSNLQSTGTVKIAKALQNISSLRKLYINNNHITDEVADDIATVCSCNTQLQTFHFHKNSFTNAYGLHIQCNSLLKFNVFIRY